MYDQVTLLCWKDVPGCSYVNIKILENLWNVFSPERNPITGEVKPPTKFLANGHIIQAAAAQNGHHRQQQVTALIHKKLKFYPDQESWHIPNSLSNLNQVYSQEPGYSASPVSYPQ